jgi:hypothetical protein
MEATIYIPIPSAAVHAVYLAILVSAIMVTWQVCRVVNDRAWDADVRRRAKSSLRMSHVAPAPADVIYRPNPEIAIFKACPWRRPEEEELMAA